MILSKPQCSTGKTQSRPFPARAGKIMASAGHYTRQNAAGGSGELAEKQNACAGIGSGQTNHATALDLKPRPNPLKWRVSCPDCGYIVTDEDYRKRLVDGHEGFDCPRCAAHYSAEDFHEELRQKHMAMHHNLAQADLSQEELE